MVLTDSIQLPIRALIELRYRSDGGRFPYAKAMDGQINSVWRVVEASLPAEVAKLICDDNPSNL